jgi:hypothetical protein
MLPPRSRALIVEPRDYGVLLEADVASETEMRDPLLAGLLSYPRLGDVEKLRDLGRVQEPIAHDRHHAPKRDAGGGDR